MKYSVTWTAESISTFEDRVTYLKFIGQKKKANFKKNLLDYLEILKVKPVAGKKPGKLACVYISVIIKQVSLIYRVKTITKEVELISFIDNRQILVNNRKK